VSRHPPEYRDSIQRGLAREAERLARAVLPDGRLTGLEWQGHGPDGAKWGVVIRGNRIGRWQNFGAGNGGSQLLSFVRDAACGGDFRQAEKWAVAFLGGQVAELAAPTPGPRPDDIARRAENGLRLFLAGRPFNWDEPAGAYLEGRGLHRGYFARPPGALRFHPGAFNGEANRPMPAMVAAVIDVVSNKQVAVHRTWLEYRDGGWTKAARLENAKTSLGPIRGGIIPLVRGESGKPWSKAPGGDHLILAEGIENALSMAACCPAWRAAAYVSAANLSALDLPVAFASVLLVEDRDGENAGVVAARQETMAHWTREGRTVQRWRPSPGIKDANDMLRALQAAE
jgi:Toprim domain-containing protein